MVADAIAHAAGDEESGFRIPLLSSLPFDRQLRVLGFALLVFLLLSVASAYLDKLETARGARYVAQSSELLMLSQRLAKDAQQALLGNHPAFEDMIQSRDQMVTIVRLLDKGDPTLPATSGLPRRQLDALMRLVQKADLNVRAVAQGRPGLVTVKSALNASNGYGQQLRDLLQELANRPDDADKQTILHLSLLVERIAKDAGQMQGGASAEQTDALRRDVAEAANQLNALPAADPQVAKLRELFDGYRQSVESISGGEQGMLGAQQAAKAIFDDSDALLQQARALTHAYQEELTTRLSGLVVMLSSGMVLLLLLVLSKQYMDESRRRAREAEQANLRNQQAILLLKRELAELADGDLTVQATVSGNVTGSIAETVNYTTDELRKLVARVIDASARVTLATAEAEAVAQDLLAVAQQQAEKLRATGAAVERITHAIREIDNSALQSAQVARHTLEVTAQGTQAVSNTIAGMDGIRAQIQETAKRIKRLGESSQEIGEIVDLISDLTEQTNVLALNAAIQAAAAGEAGRGFSVVAEEVQRLAERSAEATRQIGTLVKTIQGDTQDAVAAMEKSTQGVVEGARLSEVAGRSLQEIEQVSHELAELIDKISVSTQVQADITNKVAAAMVEILRLTEQTSGGTSKTTASVSELAGLAVDLKTSVAGFKL